MTFCHALGRNLNSGGKGLLFWTFRCCRGCSVCMCMCLSSGQLWTLFGTPAVKVSSHIISPPARPLHVCVLHAWIRALVTVILRRGSIGHHVNHGYPHTRTCENLLHFLSITFASRSNLEADSTSRVGTWPHSPFAQDYRGVQLIRRFRF